MDNDVVVVGGGIAGLTASAFLAKSGIDVLLLEKNGDIGGLVNSFKRNGFTFDGGIRATENSGILFPMLRKLGIEIDFAENEVSLGFKKDVVYLKDPGNLKEYGDLLKKHFKNEASNIDRILAEIKKINNYVDILYGIDNPIFLDIKKDRKYLLKVILPWIFKYITTVNKVERLKVPIKDHLANFTKDASLVDIRAQHFFEATPAFFALGYFSIYTDYHYPTGGTGTLTQRLKDNILENKGIIKCDTEIKSIDTEKGLAADIKGNEYNYKKLIWAADLKMLYKILQIEKIKNKSTREKITKVKDITLDKKGGESVFTLYLCTDLDKKYFSDIASGHFFYTPSLKGLSNAGSIGKPTKNNILKWLKEYISLNTFEISIPVLRDSSLAPEGKTGLIISILFDYDIIKNISDSGWYDEFKKICEDQIIEVLDKSIYPGLAKKIINQFSSTPMTFKKRYNNSEGAITGWAFTNKNIPVETRMIKIASIPITPIPDIFQAGQWAYSPSGLPTSIMAGKMAADRAIKELK